VICGSGRYIVHCVPNRPKAPRKTRFLSTAFLRLMLTTMHKRLSWRIPLNDRKSKKPSEWNRHRYWCMTESLYL
jgi:hypothetical protein